MRTSGTPVTFACLLVATLGAAMGCGGNGLRPDGGSRGDAARLDARDASPDRSDVAITDGPAGADASDGSESDGPDATDSAVPVPDARDGAGDGVTAGDAPPMGDARDGSPDVAAVDAPADVVSADVPVTVDLAADGPSDAGGPPTNGFDLPGVLKLVPDPAAGWLYALLGSQVVVFDVTQKKEVARVPLGAASNDLDLSADGTLLVAAQDRSLRLAVIDKASWGVSYVSVRADPQQVEAMNGNFAYYATLDQHSEVHQVDLQFGVAADVKLNLSAYQPDIELSAAGDRLFIGESSISGGDLLAMDLTVAPARMADKSTWDSDYGFYSPQRHVYLGPSGKNIYYAGHQLDTTRLFYALGDIGKVFAEDAAATFAVSARGFVDAKLRTLVAPFPKEMSTAALTKADTEVWFYEPTGGRLSYAKVADYLGGKTLGVRESAAADIATYSFSKIIADPVRPRLYGLDSAKSVLVSIDRAAGTTLRAAVIEYQAKDVEIDAAGKYIYVGHSGMAIEQIDAETLALVQYVFAPRDSYDLVPLNNDRIATIDWDQWTTATIIDTTTGKVLSTVSQIREGALAATADGRTLFVAGSDGTDAVSRFDVSAGTVQAGTKSAAFTSPGRGVVVTPDGTSVYYGDACLNGANLAERRYQQTDRILSVSPNGLLAASAAKIYRVSDGTALMTLPAACPIQVISPDSATLHCYLNAAITKISLAGLN